MAMPGTAIPGTSAGGLYGRAPHLADNGSFTTTIYGYIRDEKYADAIRLLYMELQNIQKSRPALSLLGYCYYQLQDYREAANCYEGLCRYHPEVESYRVYYAQCLYKLGQYADATKVCQRVDSEQYAGRILQLQVAIAYEDDDIPKAKSLISQRSQNDPDTLVNIACIIYKEGKFEEARLKFEDAMSTLGYSPDIAYNIALCHYSQGNFDAALHSLAEIIERGVREHPELSVGSATGGLDVRSVGNSQPLRDSFLVEALNLKCAIEYACGNLPAAQAALSDMPPRNEDELDPVTLHNLGLVNMDTDPAGGFSKLNFVLSNPPFPPEAFANLLLLYLRHGYSNLAADIMAENPLLAERYLSEEQYNYLSAVILAASSPDAALQRLDEQAGRHIEGLRRLTKQIQDARLNSNAGGVTSAHSQQALRQALLNYDKALESFMPVLLASARLCWDAKNHALAEKILRQAAEFASDHPAWQTNVAHLLFVSGSKFAEAARFYENLVRKHWNFAPGGDPNASGSLANVPAIVLANLCVCYILTAQNETAEEVMRRLEWEEDRQSLLHGASPSNSLNSVPLGSSRIGSTNSMNSSNNPNLNSSSYRLCIVNLVIGTLYATKGNFEFGVTRVIKSLEPLNRRLCADTWYFAKRCLVELVIALARHTATVSEGLLLEICAFLEAVDKFGAKMIALVPAGFEVRADKAQSAFSHTSFSDDANNFANPTQKDVSTPTIRAEARILRRYYRKLLYSL